MGPKCISPLSNPTSPEVPPLQPPQIKPNAADRRNEDIYLEPMPSSTTVPALSPGNRKRLTKIADFLLPYANPKTKKEHLILIGSTFAATLTGVALGGFGLTGVFVGAGFGIVYIIGTGIVRELSSDPNRTKT